MTAIITLLALFTVSTIVTKVASAWLMATGMSARYARFQARSAFTGVGFTTTEAESVVNHPVRRRVITRLMLMGNLGVGAIIASLVLSYDGAGSAGTAHRTVLLVVGGLIVVAFARSTTVDRALVAATRRIMRAGHGGSSPDRATIANVGGDYDVVELAVHDDDWMCGRTLADLRPKDEGVIILGVERKGIFAGDLDKEDRLADGDIVVVFGRREAIEELDDRRRGIGGELAHVDRVSEHRSRRLSIDPDTHGRAEREPTR